MKKISSKKLLFLYAIGGFGINLLNVIVGSYLCDALLTSGFKENLENWTYASKDLVIASIWSIFILIAKIIDGVIDIPVAGITDNLRTRIGRRRPSLIVGLISVLAFYGLFIIIPRNVENDLVNTIFYGIILCLYYISYTLVMGTYYATFAEIAKTDKDRMYISNVKSVFDVIYFILGFALIPVLVGYLNIRIIALIFMPLALTMLIPIFLIKEKSNRLCDIEKRRLNGEDDGDEIINNEEQVNMGKSIALTVKNKSFLMWMLVLFFMQFGVQMFLTGMNVYFSGALSMKSIKLTYVSGSTFLLVPLTMILFNKIVSKTGFKFGFQYSLIAFTIGMLFIFFDQYINDETMRLIFAIIGGVISSFGIGSFFSATYVIPSQLAADEASETGVSHSAMYFAVQGLVSGISVGISTGIVWVNLKKGNLSNFMPIFVAASLLICFICTFFLPKSISNIGKKTNK